MSPQYAMDFRNDYDSGPRTQREKEELIRRTIDTANRKTRPNNPIRLGQNSIVALLQLHRRHGVNSLISMRQMKVQSPNLAGSPSAGLYIWDLPTGNNVVETEKGPKGYRIRTEFYGAVERVLTEHKLI